jgi:esterase/lipase superfamily enzyme
MATAFEILKNACGKKSYKSFKDLVPGQYNVDNFKKMSTRYGVRVLVLIEGVYYFLPNHFVPEIGNDQRIAELNQSKFIMTYLGKSVEEQNRIMVKFAQVTTNNETHQPIDGVDTVQ